MKELFSLGKLYPCDFLKSGEEPRCEPVELKLMLDDNGTARLAETAPKEAMWGEKYWYRSSINATMRRQLKTVVDSILSIYAIHMGSVWLDVAANDGYLLSCVPAYLKRVGIDPANDSFRLECERHADYVIQDYFSAEAFKKSKYGNKKVSVITMISMFYDVPEPDEFLRDVYEILEDDGLVVAQLSYAPLMISGMAWDSICHEHKFYYSLFNLKRLFEKNGFRILDCELNNTNAGSFRVYAMKIGGGIAKFGSQTHRDVCQFRINSILEYEKTLKLDETETWMKFYENIQFLKERTVEFIKRKVAEGKTVMGYGASTKGSTVLQYFGLANTLITAIADRSSYKHGLRTVGGNIPIISEEEMRQRNPDFLLILPFHFLEEFVEREGEYLLQGGAMIVLCPEFKIIKK